MKTALLLFSLLSLPLLVLGQLPYDTVWTRTFTDLPSAAAFNAVNSFDGGFVFVGKQEFLPADTHDTFGPCDLLVFQTDATGNRDWTFRMVSVRDTSWEDAYICRTPDSAYAVITWKLCQSEGSSVVLFKISRQGELLLRRDYVYETSEYPNSIAVLNNGTYIIGARLSIPEPNPFCTNFMWVLNLNTEGDTLWTRRWKGDQCERYTYYVLPTVDGGCLVVGTDCPIMHQPCSQTLIKLDEDGNTEWERMEDPAESGRVTGLELPDGYLFGSNFWIEEGPVTQMEKVGETGVPQWTHNFDLTPNRSEFKGALYPAADGGYLLAGSTQLYTINRMAPLLIKTDANGEFEWRMYPDWPMSVWPRAFCQTAGGEIVMGGSVCVTDIQGPCYPWLGRFTPTLTPVDRIVVQPASFSLSVYPNPFNSVTRIRFELPAAQRVELSIVNTLGERVAVLADEHFAVGAHTVSWDASALASGMYFARVETPNARRTTKLMLLK